MVSTAKGRKHNVVFNLWPTRIWILTCLNQSVMVLGFFYYIKSHRIWARTWVLKNPVSLLLALLAQIKEDKRSAKDHSKSGKIKVFFRTVILKIIYCWKIEVIPVSHIKIERSKSAIGINKPIKKRTEKVLCIQHSVRNKEKAVEVKGSKYGPQ